MRIEPQPSDEDEPGVMSQMQRRGLVFSVNEYLVRNTVGDRRPRLLGDKHLRFQVWGCAMNLRLTGFEGKCVFTSWWAKFLMAEGKGVFT